MKKTPFRLAVAILAVLSFPAASIAAGETVKKYRFDDYAVSEKYTGPSASPILTDPEAAEFKTRLIEAAKRSPDFAGRFIVAKWGCGTGCVTAAFIDAKSGAVFMLPFAAFAAPQSKVELLEYRLDSSLFVVHGSRDEEEAPGDFYYRWDGKNLLPITGTK